MLKNDVAGTMPKQNTFLRIITLSWLKRSTIVEIIALFFVILFLYTGISKLMDFLVFQEQLAESPVLAPVAPLIAWGLPITEFIVSILLFFPRFRLTGLYASFVLMFLFTGYVIAVLSFSTELPCSCGGIIELLSWKGHLIFNSLLILLAYTAIRMQKKLRKNTY
jgi:uncharacterized membrane protein YphA (DoxX/SURF4 family)